MTHLSAPWTFLVLIAAALACLTGCQRGTPAGASPTPSPVAVKASPRAGSPSPAAPGPTATRTPTPTPVTIRAASPSPSPRVNVPPGPTYTAKLHHQAATTDIRHIYAQKLAEVADAQTRGRLKIEITAAGQTYPGDLEQQALGRGDIQLSLPRLTELSTFDPIWQAIDLPFLISPQAAGRLNGSVPGRTLWQSLEPHGIGGLSFVNLHDPVILYTKDRPIRHLNDLKGLRVRSYLANPALHDEWLRLFGAGAISLPGSEVYPAIQRGQIDAVLTTISAARDLRLPEVMRYGNLIPISAVPMGLAANLRWYNALPRELRRALDEEVIPEANAAFSEYLAGYVADRRDRAARDGLEFVQPSPEVADGMKRRTEADLYPRVAGNYPGELVREIQLLQ